ncbi:MAG: 3-methyl-2-oxobutanoate hydroxymethyltransferase [Kiritimatiellae bacterium]|nr:3-methyl-2-oxobutanoate hydroxymethyltransferase [Kiritimatiellia bacterium]MDD4735568.1 3-methyl-2-oxobutanoate hydroxymethyltransferase [Kiritimatiellia bacterium]
MSDKWTAQKIKQFKGKGRLAALTAHDFSLARLVDAAGVPIILVGDSLGMYAQGNDNTLPVTMDQMVYHTTIVARGVKNALVIADMPFLSYQASDNEAMRNAGRFLKEAHADGVKVEGGSLRAPLIRRMVENGIPVMGHIGLTPQSIHAFGGYKIQGRTHPEAQRLLEDAKALDEAGVFSLVLECVPAALGAEITAAVSIPTLGIGGGPACDGQILVTHDILGLLGDFKPRFVKRYADLGEQVVKTLKQYREEVEQGAFPDAEHSY